MKRLFLVLLLAPLIALAESSPWQGTGGVSADAYGPEWQMNKGAEGPGAGKRIVLVSGDEEYRSEEALPQLAKILSKRHGFDTVVLFAQDPSMAGIINPNYSSNIPGLEALREADLMIIATRFRDLPDDQMQEVDNYLKSGRPVMGLRTATHAFNIPADKKWAHYSFNYRGDKSYWQGGFGEAILGTSWVAHHGWHKKESARGIITDAHAISSGVESGSIWSAADVYTVKPLGPDATPIVWGQVLTGMNPDDEPIGPGPYEYTPRFAKEDPDFDKNNPMQPIAWTKPYQIPGGKKGKVFASTLGASVDLSNASTRRLLVQGAYWLLDMEIPEAGVNAGLVGSYQPNMFGFHKQADEPDYWPKKGLRIESAFVPKLQQPTKGESIVLIGNGLAERMVYFPHFETSVQHRFPQAEAIVRNLGFPGDTPGFRPRAGRHDQWAFPGAEKFHPDLQTHLGIGHYESPDEWLNRLQPDKLLAFFGYNESFNGKAGLARFEAELDAFVQHTLAQSYNGRGASELYLVSPTAFEDLSTDHDLPNGEMENKNLQRYSAAIKRVAEFHGVNYIDMFWSSKKRMEQESDPQTINGFALTTDAYKWFGQRLSRQIYPAKNDRPVAQYDAVYRAVDEKNWFWRNDYAILNGVHVYGRRYAPFGNENYPEEIEKNRQMTQLRDAAIHRVAQGEIEDVRVDDSTTRSLTDIETNFDRPIEFLAVDKALESFDLPDGFEIDLFASESEFPELRNPVQMSWDNQGRLWVAVIPSYPHYRPGDEKPNDKLLIFEDTDGDGRADRQKTFADGLHMPIGFELAPEGVYLAQQPNLVLLVDDNGDDRADRTEILVHGFDPHDTHHSISAFSADPSGAIYMNEGRFLHSQVETPYGPERASDGGVWRWDPTSWRLERFMQTDVSNPWGIAFDEWGQMFLSDASGGSNWWSVPLSAKIPHGQEIRKVAQFTTQRVRPTSGTAFIHSRHFPDHVQGDFLINNTIGFLGTKQHTMVDDGAGFTGSHRQDLIVSDDPNFRPVDMEFGPDGALYIVDWHNPLIGHMQHSARDPNRDHDHGRIYRVTYPDRPLVTPVKIAGESVETLLDLLKTPELHTRYRVRRELRGHDAAVVLPAVKAWVASLDKNDPDYDRHRAEALWTTWGQNQVDADLLEACLNAKTPELRAAAVYVLRYAHRQIENSNALFLQAAKDSNARVRLSALVAASWLDNKAGAKIALTALQIPNDHWAGFVSQDVWNTLEDDITALAKTGGLDAAATAFIAKVRSEEIDLAEASRPVAKDSAIPITNMSAPVQAAFKRGQEIYQRDGYCATCHGEDGKGAIAGVYPPLVESEWIDGDDDLLIKIILKGVWGTIRVNGVEYDPKKGVPPMTPFEGMLNDQEIADVATYTRVAFRGNKVVTELSTPENVAELRAATKDQKTFYTPEQLLEQHPDVAARAATK
jgi:mono/diheme cytochrome c family protein/glucose/arabinose dehydrogenase